MVYRGASRGCRTCREKKRKCDETRPSCLACTRSKKECPGYRTDSELYFRDGAPDGRARSRTRSPGDRIARLDPSLASDHELEELATEYFLRDYCVRPCDAGLSRGFFQRTAAKIREGGPASRVSKTARVVALEGLGRRWGRPEVRQRARQLYQDELKSFQGRMTDEIELDSDESLMVITLFGIYEIMSTPYQEDGEHSVHALGITALLPTPRVSPPALGMTTSMSDFASSTLDSLMRHGLLCPPNAASSPSSSSEPNLDILALELASLFDHADALLVRAETRDMTQIRALFYSAHDAFYRMREWERRQTSLAPAQFVGIAEGSLAEREHGRVFWPGRVYVYRDLWIAAVWLIARQSIIKFAHIAISCVSALDSPDHHLRATASQLREEAQPVILDFLASVPFFLLAKIKRAFGFAQQPKPLEPGPPAGGLLAMHPIYLVAGLGEVVRPEVAKYLRECLVWIDDWQGISQARPLSQTQYVPCRSMRDAHTIVWAGMVM